MTHRWHPYGDDPIDAILFDDCEDCLIHVKSGGLSLDFLTWWSMWDRMIGVEFGQDKYRSAAEASLGGKFYQLYIMLDRYTSVNARQLERKTHEEHSVRLDEAKD